MSDEEWQEFTKDDLEWTDDDWFYAVTKPGGLEELEAIAGTAEGA